MHTVGVTEQVTNSIIADLKERLPGQRKTQREMLGRVVATMLDVRSANIVELAAGFPSSSDRTDMRYQRIIRLLGNPLVDCDQIMESFARDALTLAGASGEPIVLILDQTKISDKFQVLMLALRQGERALAVAWRVEATDGAIGFATQKALLEVVAPWMPDGATVVLMGDRFYGTADLIQCCQELGWDYRLRLKGNLVVDDGKTKTTTGACATGSGIYLENVALTSKRALTHIGIIHDAGHEEPWIIAMSRKPG